jgi:hypothetical protein
LQPDGTFRFDDLPPGDYSLVISETVNCGLRFETGDWFLQSAFTVDFSPESEPQNEKTLELGRMSPVLKQ